MWGYEAEISSIRSSGDAAQEAIEAVTAEDPADTGAKLTAAMPGSAAAGAASTLADHWHRRFPAWARSMRTYGDNLHRSADAYEANEAAAERALGDVSPGEMRPI